MGSSSEAPGASAIFVSARIIYFLWLWVGLPPSVLPDISPQGGRSSRGYLSPNSHLECEMAACAKPISLLVGEMPGRAEGGKPHPLPSVRSENLRELIDVLGVIDKRIGHGRFAVFANLDLAHASGLDLGARLAVSITLDEVIGDLGCGVA